MWETDRVVQFFLAGVLLVFRYRCRCRVVRCARAFLVCVLCPVGMRVFCGLRVLCPVGLCVVSSVGLRVPRATCSSSGRHFVSRQTVFCVRMPNDVSSLPHAFRGQAGYCVVILPPKIPSTPCVCVCVCVCVCWPSLSAHMFSFQRG